MKKKYVAFLMVLVIAILSFAGCKKNVGTSEDNAIKKEDSGEEEPSYTFGFSAITMDNPYYITLEASIRDTVENSGYTMKTMDPAGVSDTQCDQISEMIEQGIDAIFLVPVDWEGIQPAIDALNEAEVAIINVDTEVKDIDHVNAYVGTDNKNAGALCGQDLIERHPEGGDIVILECPTMNSINNRITGFEESIKDQGFSVVERKDVQGDLEKARAATEELLQKHSDISAIMCGNDQTALGALVSVNAAEREDILIYGVDGSPDLKKELEKKETSIAGTAAQSPITIGTTSVQIALKILNGEDYEKATYQTACFVDKDNVDIYGVDGWQ